MNIAPRAARDLPPPVVGLVGQLSERIDLDILDGLVDAGFALLIVGPAKRGGSRRGSPR